MSGGLKIATVPRNAPGAAPAMDGAAHPRVLLLVPTLRVGGAERIVSALARHLAAAGWPVAVTSMFDPPGSPIEMELRAAGIPLVFLAKRPGLDLKMIPRLARVLRAYRPDVVHTHGYVLRYAVPALLLARRPPVVHTVHNLAQHETDPLGIAIQFLAFRTGVAPVAIGDAVAESIRKVHRLDPRCTIPNGIPVAAYARVDGARREVRAELGIPADVPVFLAVGRLMTQKNHALLLDAVASERLATLGARLLLVGDGELRDVLRARARERGLESRVFFLGMRGDVPRLLSACDAFVLSSSWEGNPLSVMEAMAAGTPVVATAVGCVPELVPPEAGRVIPPGDLAALEAALLAVAADPPRARATGIAAARVARERFDEAVMVRAYQHLYEEITGWSSRPTSRSAQGS